jgi:WD40 repeat protein
MFQSAAWTQGAGSLLSITFLLLGCQGARLDTDAAIRAEIRMPGSAESIACSRDGKLMAACGSAGLIVYDIASLSPVLSIASEEGHIFSVVFSPDNTQLATCSENGTAIIWDVGTGRRLYYLNGHSGWVQTVAFSPDGSLLATGGRDGIIIVWETANGKKRGICSTETHGPRSQGVKGVSFSSDGKLLISIEGDSNVRIWSATGFTEMRNCVAKGLFDYLQVLPDGSAIVSASSVGDVRLWDASNCRQLLEFGEGFQTSGNAILDCISASRDSRLLACAYEGSTFDRARLIINDLKTGKILAKREGRFGGLFTAVQFDESGQTIFTGNIDGRLLIWDVNKLLEERPSS